MKARKNPVRKSGAQVLIAVEILALVLVVVFLGLQKGKSTIQDKAESSQKNTQVVSQQETSSQEEPQTEETQVQPQVEAVVFSEEVNQKLASMTLEEKVAQMFMITPEMLTNTDKVNVAGNATKNAIQTYPVGGLVYSAKNFQGKEQTKSLLSKTQQYATERMGVPMFLAIEEVGGEANSPIAVKNRYEVQTAPSAITDGTVAKTNANNISKYLTESGITMNIVPFGNLSKGTNDKVAFGTDASQVSVLAAESISGYEEKNIKTAVGVFPGTVNTENGDKALAEWKEADALVFKATINAGCDCMVVGNILYKDLTESEATICSMSENVVQYIRGDLGFKGILMTDSLSQEVVTRNYSPEEAAVNAIKAGMNVLYCPQNFTEAYQGVVDAVNNNDIKIETIDESVGRILTVKMSQ